MRRKYNKGETLSNRKGRIPRAVSAWAALCVCLCLGAAPATVAGAQQPHTVKLDGALAALSTGLVRVIVRTEPGQDGAVADGLRGRGQPVLKKHSIIDALTTEVPVEDLALLTGDPAVASVSLDALVTGSAESSSGPSTPSSTLLATLGLPLDGLTGKGVGVAVIDSGVEPTGDFSGVRAYDFTGGGARDEYGHGTHLGGLMASKGVLSENAFPGVAPRARIVSLKVLDARGQGLTSTVIEALEFAALNRKALGIDVVNLSLGHPILEPASTDPLVQAVEAVTRAGIVVVVSAGNVGRHIRTGEPGYAGILSPGNSPSAITAGAVDTKNTASRGDDVVPTYSSRGPSWYDAFPKPDLVAPGHNLVSNATAGSTLYTQFPDRQVDGTGTARFLRLSGTSLSAAVTSGVVALMIEAGRAVGGTPLPPAALKAILLYTALPMIGLDPLTQGHGALNASGAVALTTAVAMGPPPADLADVQLSPVTTIDGESWTWGQTVVWGNTETVVWGNTDTVVWGNTETVVWGNTETVVWGNSTGGALPFWAQTVVWGNVEWGASVEWGNPYALTWETTVVWGNTETVVWGNANGSQ
jgi:serine protease AprX